MLVSEGLDGGHVMANSHMDAVHPLMDLICGPLDLFYRYETVLIIKNISA